MSDLTEGPGVINYRLTAIENSVSAIAGNMSQLILLEQKHLETREALARAFKHIDAHDVRLVAIEVELPTLKLARGWVIAGTIGTLAMVGIFVIKLAMH